LGVEGTADPALSSCTTCRDTTIPWPQKPRWIDIFPSQGRSTSERGEILAGLRSFHIRHSRNEVLEAPVAAPVQLIFYRAVETGVVEIVRVLHERMEPSGRIAVDRE
jgi:hypothetical protein